MTDEIQLIKEAQKGDIEAFSGLVKLYQGNVRACLAVRIALLQCGLSMNKIAGDRSRADYEGLGRPRRNKP